MTKKQEENIIIKATLNAILNCKQCLYLPSEIWNMPQFDWVEPSGKECRITTLLQALKREGAVGIVEEATAFNPKVLYFGIDYPPEPWQVRVKTHELFEEREKRWHEEVKAILSHLENKELAEELKKALDI